MELEEVGSTECDVLEGFGMSEKVNSWTGIVKRTEVDKDTILEDDTWPLLDLPDTDSWLLLSKFEEEGR